MSVESILKLQDDARALISDSFDIINEALIELAGEGSLERSAVLTSYGNALERESKAMLAAARSVVASLPTDEKLALLTEAATKGYFPNA